MVNNSDVNLDAVFSALSDKTRREMLCRLASGVMSVKELADPFSMSKPAITKHLKVLEKAGLLQRVKDGRVHRCYLQPGPLSEVADWVSVYKVFWEAQFDGLEDFLKDANKERK